MPPYKSLEPSAFRRHDYMGCPVDPYTLEGAAREIIRRANDRTQTSVVHFTNIAKIVRAIEDPTLKAALWDGDLVLADGKPLLPLARALGIELPARVNGTDLMERVIELCAQGGLSIYLLGATEEIVTRAVQALADRHPGLRIVGHRNGYFSDEQIPRMIDAINISKPHVLFVGIPTPQKELFAFGCRASLRIPVIQGVGGSFDVLAGAVRRAPLWMQRSGLEWFWRVIQEPRRLFWRYASTNVLFFRHYVVAVYRRVRGHRHAL